MTMPFAPFAQKSLFLVWGPPSHGPRSQVFARELGIAEIHFIYATSRRGAWIAPLKYVIQAFRTVGLLFQKRPSIVFVQSPPSLAVLVVCLYTTLTHTHYIVDAHSAALLLPYWTRPQWLHRFLARKALATIVTNEYFQKMIASWGGHALILHDIPTTFPHGETYPLNGDFNVAVVNTFSNDEPLAQVLTAAAALDGVHFYVTGKKSRGNPKLMEQAPLNVSFTDFLPVELYYSLLRSSHAIMCLTTRDHTMQRGACEALSLGKPVITSNWPVLREYFHKGTVHVGNSVEDIYQGVLDMKSNYAHYLAGILELQGEQQSEWKKKIFEITDLVRGAVGSSA